MTQGDEALLWRAAPAPDLRCEPLGTLTLVYDRRSGQTHLLASPLPEILDTLGREALTIPALAKCLAERFDVEGEGDALTLLVARVDELAAMGLADRV